MSDETKNACPNGCACGSNFDPEDVTTWSNEYFEQKSAEKLRKLWAKVETTKRLLKDGKQVIAYEQLQGLSDALGIFVKLFESRIPPKSDNPQS